MAFAETLKQPDADALTACTLIPAGGLCAPRGKSWRTFRDSWNDLPADRFMADGGTYRQRRYAAFHVCDGAMHRLPPQAHFQDIAHNRLNGGVERWFDPVSDEVAHSPVFHHILAWTMSRLANMLPGRAAHWHVEAHQFRIVARADQPGLPTPEGMHRDGRDWVLIGLIGHHNMNGGETVVRDRQGRLVMAHRLAQAGEGLWLDDHSVWHGTAPVTPRDPCEPAWRDTLVLTFSETGPD